MIDRDKRILSAISLLLFGAVMFLARADFNLSLISIVNMGIGLLIMFLEARVYSEKATNSINTRSLVVSFLFLLAIVSVYCVVSSVFTTVVTPVYIGVTIVTLLVYCIGCVLFFLQVYLQEE